MFTCASRVADPVLLAAHQSTVKTWRETERKTDGSKCASPRET